MVDNNNSNKKNEELWTVNEKAKSQSKLDDVQTKVRISLKAEILERAMEQINIEYNQAVQTLQNEYRESQNERFQVYMNEKEVMLTTLNSKYTDLDNVELDKIETREQELNAKKEALIQEKVAELEALTPEIPIDTNNIIDKVDIADTTNNVSNITSKPIEMKPVTESHATITSTTPSKNY